MGLPAFLDEMMDAGDPSIPEHAGGDHGQPNDPTDAADMETSWAATDGDAHGEGLTSELVPPPCEGDPLGPMWPEDADSTFLRGPALQDVRNDHAVVVFRPAIPLPDPGCVQWSPASQDGPPRVTCDDPDERGQYEVRLDGLPTDDLVTYTVFIGADVTVGPFTFRAAPPPGRPQRILVLSDIHATSERNETILGPLVRAALAEGVDLLVTVGDSVSQPEEAQLDTLFDGLHPLLHRLPAFMTLGNHEARSQNYFAAFVLPEADPPDPLSGEMYYDFRRGNVWIGVLEITDFLVTWFAGMDFGEVAWLRARLDSPEARTARWRLLFIHEPPWNKDWAPCESDAVDGEEALRAVLLPLALNKGVHATFSGHAHTYGRGTLDGMALVVCGGAGGTLDLSCPAPEGLPQPWVEAHVHHRVLVDAGCDTLTIRAVDLDLIMKARGVTRRDVVPQLGYPNIREAYARFDALAADNVLADPTILSRLARVLDLREEDRSSLWSKDEELDTLAQIRMHQQGVAKDRANFVPHLWRLHERSRPEPIFVVALTGVERWKRVDLPNGIRNRPLNEQFDLVRTVIREDVASATRGLFGQIAGYVYRHSYSIGFRFDREGR